MRIWMFTVGYHSDGDVPRQYVTIGMVTHDMGMINQLRHPFSAKSL